MPRYHYYKLAPGEHRFWKVNRKKALSIGNCARSYGKRHGMVFRPKVVDGGVYVFRDS